MTNEQAVDRTVYLNGAFLPRDKAALPVEDRGTMFSDGAYEVVRYIAGQSFALDDHLQRLRRSLEGVRIPEPADVAKLPEISDELVRRNGLENAKVYWQVTRGQAPRDHPIPANPRPSVLAIAYPGPPIQDQPRPAQRAVLVEDMRWTHCWIKSLMLLPSVLARDDAVKAGANDAIMHKQGRVTEASASNVFLVKEGEIFTSPADGSILAGITRQHQLDLARQENIPAHERAFTCDELLDADELWLTSTTMDVQPITHVNDKPIGDGSVGPITRRIAAAFARHVRANLV